MHCVTGVTQARSWLRQARLPDLELRVGRRMHAMAGSAEKTLRL